MQAIENMSDKDLARLEKQIAAKYMNRIPWFIVFWAFANTTTWIALWPLVMLGYLPLWAGYLIAQINMVLAYLPSHDAQHGIIALKGQKLRWLNELVGHVALIPLASSFQVLRYTHFEHHTHTNDPEKDPDIGSAANDRWEYIKNGILRMQPGSEHADAYLRTLERIGKSHLIRHQVVLRGIELGLLFTLAWSGYILEALFLWLLAKIIGLMYTRYFLSWAPHHPGLGMGRYKDTRGFKSAIGNVLSMGMQYHIVHHLYPRIPLMLTPAAYRELKPVLQARKCELGGL